MIWQLQEAKNKFSEVVQRAMSEGPQIVTLRGVRKAVVLSAEAYDELTAKKPSFTEFLVSGGPWPDEFVNEVNRRDKTPSRHIEF
jgi:prevent-host-death family protein